MTYPPDPYGGSPGSQGQQPGWPAQQPGYPVQQPGWAAGPQPDNYLVWAILTTLFCCLPFGIVSIVYSSKVSGLWMQGQYAEAQTAADNAKKWAIISAVVGVATFVIGIILWFAMIGAIVSSIPSTTTTTYSGY